MQMLYDSRQYVVVAIEVPGGVEAEAAPALSRGGYEIVDKFARKEIFIEGALAASFELGVQALFDEGRSSEDELDDFIEGYAAMGQTSVQMH